MSGSAPTEHLDHLRWETGVIITLALMMMIAEMLLEDDIESLQFEVTHLAQDLSSPASIAAWMGYSEHDPEQVPGLPCTLRGVPPVASISFGREGCEPPLDLTFGEIRECYTRAALEITELSGVLPQSLSETPHGCWVADLSFPSEDGARTGVVSGNGAPGGRVENASPRAIETQYRIETAHLSLIFRPVDDATGRTLRQWQEQRDVPFEVRVRTVRLPQNYVDLRFPILAKSWDDIKDLPSSIPLLTLQQVALNRLDQEVGSLTIADLPVFSLTALLGVGSALSTLVMTHMLAMLRALLESARQPAITKPVTGVPHWVGLVDTTFARLVLLAGVVILPTIPGFYGLSLGYLPRAVRVLLAVDGFSSVVLGTLVLFTSQALIETNRPTSAAGGAQGPSNTQATASPPIPGLQNASAAVATGATASSVALPAGAGTQNSAVFTP